MAPQVCVSGCLKVLPDGTLTVEVDGTTINCVDGVLTASVSPCTEISQKVVAEGGSPDVPIPLTVNFPGYTLFDGPFSVTIVNPSPCKTMLVGATITGAEMGLSSTSNDPCRIQLQPYVQEDGGTWNVFNDGGSDIDIDSDNLDLNTFSMASAGWARSWVIGPGASKTVAQQREYRRDTGDGHPWISESHRISMWGVT